ncbi:MAG: PLD nuclease N-terminal domain-containing protein, partial [Planctomycetes bacterium]|nr:PLD nuclease N-terminal domain-containing protein [Planctomycetota bacterium]
FVFWVWMLIDCLKNEPSTGNDKIIWGLVIAFTGIGALLYYFIRRPERIKQTGQ